MRQIQFDDIDALREMISEEHGEWGNDYQVTQDVIQRFANLTGDHQWIHVDVERATRGPFGTTIAHGLLMLALSSRVRPKSKFVVVGHGNTVNYGSDGIRFLEPVRCGNRIHARQRLLDVKRHRSGTRLSLEVAIHVVGNERPSLIYKAVVLHASPR